MEREEGRHNVGSIIISFFLGGLVGAGVALLLAPKSGREAREQIKDLAKEVKEKTGTYVEHVKSKAATVLEKGKELIEKEKSVVSSAIDSGIEAYEKERQKLEE